MNKRRRWKAKARRRWPGIPTTYRPDRVVPPTGVIPMNYIGQHELDGAFADVYVYAGPPRWRPVFVPYTVH
jgi:hypothetical protein